MWLGESGPDRYMPVLILSIEGKTNTTGTDPGFGAPAKKMSNIKKLAILLRYFLYWLKRLVNQKTCQSTMNLEVYSSNAILFQPVARCTLLAG